ncbi:ead/Ea22-like family protein [Salmonella enterica]|nr:ead/Ea22-like family protein [Salmonella enterica]
MNNIDKQALRKMARRAGKDRWQTRKIKGDFLVIRHGSYKKQSGITSYKPIAEVDHKPVRDFIAMASPATILALLDELEVAGKRIAELERREVVDPGVSDDKFWLRCNGIPVFREETYRSAVFKALEYAGVGVKEG